MKDKESVGVESTRGHDGPGEPQTSSPREGRRPPPSAGAPRRPSGSQLPGRGPFSPSRLPPELVKKAKAAFDRFNLSKFPKHALPANYVPAGTAGADLHAAQKQLVAKQLRQLKDVKTSNRGMTVSIPEASLRALLPTFDEKKGTIDLDELMAVVTSQMRGTQFFQGGNPTLTRLALRARAQEIVAAYKPRAKL